MISSGVSTALTCESSKATCCSALLFLLHRGQNDGYHTNRQPSHGDLRHGARDAAKCSGDLGDALALSMPGQLGCRESQFAGEELDDAWTVFPEGGERASAPLSIQR